MRQPDTDTLEEYDRIARTLWVPHGECDHGLILALERFDDGTPDGGVRTITVKCTDCTDGKVWPLLTKCPEAPLPATALSMFRHWSKCSGGCNGTGLVSIYATVLGERGVPLDHLLEAAREAFGTVELEALASGDSRCTIQNRGHWQRRVETAHVAVVAAVRAVSAALAASL